MSDWIDFGQWQDCAQMERPGSIFEVRNAEGQSILTTCSDPLQLPHDWRSSPVQFRLVEAPKPRHSNPIPQPQKQTE